MAKMLYAAAQRAERGELSGAAIALVTISGKPEADWKGSNGATLGHSVARLFHIFFSKHSEG